MPWGCSSVGNTRDRDGGRSGRRKGRGTNFNQQGQQVNGPQYNADRIYLRNSVSPDAIAEGLRRYHEPPPREVNYAHLQQQQEERDLRDYGYRHYTRDRQRWLQSLPARERLDEQRRESDRRTWNKSIAYHRRILRAGNLPPETSPADPRYLQAKKEVDRTRDKRARYYTVASIAVMLALALIAIRDGATWLVVICGFAMVVGLVYGYLQSKPRS